MRPAVWDGCCDKSGIESMLIEDILACKGRGSQEFVHKKCKIFYLSGKRRGKTVIFCAAVQAGKIMLNRRVDGKPRNSTFIECWRLYEHENSHVIVALPVARQRINFSSGVVVWG